MSRKPIFDHIRKLLGRAFLQHEVDALDTVLDASFSDNMTDRVPPVPPLFAPARASLGQRTVGAAGIALIKRFEGCARKRGDGMVQAYPDPGTGGDPWTIGWGATGTDRFHGGSIGPETLWSQAQCNARLEADLLRYAAEVDRAIGAAPTSPSQFDALVSFHYNTGAIARATLTRRHKSGDFAAAAGEFDRWCYAGGRVMKGLARRRMAESALYRS